MLFIMFILFLLFVALIAIYFFEQKKKVIFSLVILFCCVISYFYLSLGINKNNYVIENVELKISEELNKWEISNQAGIKEYGIEDVKVKLDIISSDSDTYYISVKVSCETGKITSEIENSLISYELFEIFEIFDGGSFKLDNGYKVDIRSDKTSELQITTIVNRIVINKPLTEEEQKEENRDIISCSERSTTINECSWSSSQGKCICK